MKNDTKKITQGAMLVALMGVFMFIDRQMAGMLSTQFGWFLSIPMILYSTQYSLKYSMSVLIATLILCFMLSSTQSMFYLGTALILGIVYGIGVRKKWKQSKLLLVCCVFTFISSFLTMYVFAAFFGYDLVAERQEIISLLQQSNLFDGQVFFMDINMIYNVLDVTVFNLIVIAESLCVHLLAHLIFMKLKMDVDRLQFHFNMVYPKMFSLGGLVSFGFILLMKSVELSEVIQFILTFLCLNMFIVNFVYGMIMIRSMRKLPKGIWIICLIVPFLWPVVVCVGIVLGLLDGNIKRRWIYG